MKKTILVLTVLFVFVLGVSSYAEMGMMGEQKGEMKPPCMMMDEGQSMSMMQMCMPMMQNMMGQQMMMKDMMQMMMDMMKIQKMMTKGMGAGDKKDMMKDMDRMMDRMDRMMSDMRGMMMKGMMGPAPVEPKGEEKKQSPEKGGQPKADPHKH